MLCRKTTETLDLIEPHKMLERPRYFDFRIYVLVLGFDFMYVYIFIYTYIKQKNYKVN